MRTSPRFARRQRGSILLVALLLCAIVGVSLGSYLSLSRNSLQLANRSFFHGAAINLAETGIEEAVWCFNQVAAGAAPSTAWSGWTINGTTAKRTFTDFSLSGGVSPSVRVMVNNYDGASGTPRVYADATLTFPGDTLTVTKAVQVDLRRRSRFAMGLVARNQITFNGNVASVDSWNSEFNADGTPRGAPVKYGPAHKRDSGSVGSTSVAVGSVAINNADIWGFASVGGSSTSGISVGTNGIIGPFGSPSGHVDTTRVATDFTANFDSVSNPSSAIDLSTFGATLGGAGVTATYRYAGAITNSFTVKGHITLILTGAGDVLKLNGGGDTLTIEAGSSLTIYTAGDINLTGGGVVNPNAQASSLQIYGTNATSQDIAIGGGAEFTGVVYAPNGNVKIHGNPDVMGSIVANNITVVGNAKFHYDEALANWGGNNPFGIVKWLELTSESQRTTAFASW